MSLLDFLNTGGKLLNAAKPFLDIGGSIYDRNQTQQGISDGFNQYKGYADKSLNTLGSVYNQGRGTLKPYLQAGNSGLKGYQNLMRNPNQITNDPGYQFRLGQANEAISRNAGAKRMLGSGNFATALSEYNQDYATNELDSALSRYLPMISAGQNAVGQNSELGRNYSYGVTGINEALGESAGGAAVGGAGANSRMVTDFLGMTRGANNPFGAAADALNNGRSAVNGLGELTNAGGGNPLTAAGQIGRETASGSGGFGDMLAGPRTSARMPSGTNLLAGAPALSGGITAGSMGAMNALGGAGTAAGVVGAPVAAPYAGGAAMQGSVAAMDALGGGANALATTTAPATAATTGTGVGSGVMAAAPYFAAAFAMPFVLKALSNLNGGAAESAKGPKAAAEIQRRLQADPSGRTAQQFMDNIITNKQWPNEGNAWVIADFMKQGLVPMTTPSLYGKSSVVNIFGSNETEQYNARRWGDDDVRTRTKDHNYIGGYGYAKSYGLDDKSASQYETLLKAVKRGEGNQGGDTSMEAVRNEQKLTAAKSALASFETRMTPASRLRNATNIRTQILAQNPRADVTKLNQFIRSNT